MTDVPGSRRPVSAIVRVAGLSAETMEPFGSSKCRRLACSVAQLEDGLRELRRQVVKRLHERIEGAPARVRRALLAVKRDCYNGRAVSPRRESSVGSIFEQTAPDLALRLYRSEQELAALEAQFEAAFDGERERELRHLLAVVDDGGLRQGIALASPVLLGGLRGLNRPLGSYRRKKERRLVQSLLRYVSRAGLKLSPFSTLTRIGLGCVEEGSDRQLRLQLDDATAWELRRIKKHSVVKYLELLRRFPLLRDRLEVQLNPTVEALDDDRYRFIRPFRWRFDEEAGEFHYFNEAQVSARLRGSSIEELRTLVSSRRRFGDVVRALSDETADDRAEIESTVCKLSEIGFLLLYPPWPTNDFDPERTLLTFLEGLPSHPDIDRFADNLARLLDLRDAPPDDVRQGGYRDVEKLRLRGFRLLTRSLGLGEVSEETSGRQLHEDVFLASRDRRRGRAVARISRSSAERALASLRPLVLYSDLNYTRYEFLHSLAELARRRWPGRQQVGLLDLFHAAQPLWGDYVEAATAAMTSWHAELWNPYDLDEIHALKRLRDEVLHEMQRAMGREGNELVIDRSAAERAVDQIPDVYRPAFGPCLFVQPASSDRDQWMLNHMLDGTGRFSNRYTTVMRDGMDDRFADQLSRVPRVGLHGEPAEVVEILCARDDHLNVHRAHTQRVIEVPGERADLAPERRLSPRDLGVRLDGPLPRLTDAAGQPLMPVFLGATSLVVMPTLVRFLSRFGLGEFRLMHPPRPPEERGGVTRFRRLRIGNLVVRRQYWKFSSTEVFGECSGRSDPELFLAFARWRHEHGIPDRIFVSERLETRFSLWPVRKPQYLDLTSPSFVPLLRTALESADGQMEIEEMLPTPDAFPVDENGRRWAVEAQLESVAFERVHPWQPSRPLADGVPGPAPHRGELALNNRADRGSQKEVVNV